MEGYESATKWWITLYHELPRSFVGCSDDFKIIRGWSSREKHVSLLVVKVFKY